MEKIIILFFILLFFFKIAKFDPLCKAGVNYCLVCNDIANLCSMCENEIYIPDNNGGCKKKCVVGINNCLECDEEGNLCIKCDIGYFYDENGGCSYTDNCEMSDNGECIKCKNNFILIGLEEGIKICKSLYSEDLKNCIQINNETGLCEDCKEGYYLDIYDKRCSTIKNCYQSVFSKCIKCKFGYYLDRKEDECKVQKENFAHCKETINSITCDICDDEYHFDENGKCISIKNCAKESSEYNICEKCFPGYYLSENKASCTIEQNCYSGDKVNGLCKTCKERFYIDYKDGKCKSNQEDNEFKYCKEANEVCTKCLDNYYLGDDYKCSTTQNCSESYNGTCVECIEDYFIGLDHKCTNIEHCIYSYYFDDCYECEDGYYYNKKNKTCLISEGIFKNCKYGNENTFCERCKDDYYLNQTDHLCYSNEIDGPFYKCAVTDENAENCYICTKDYNIGGIDHKCSKVQGCEISEDENKCLQCDFFYCLDVSTGKCEHNDEAKNKDKIFYYRCNKTNEEGTECALCIDDYVLKNGLCVDEYHCVEQNEDGTCKRCFHNAYNSFCINHDFGCIDLLYDYCLECNDSSDLDKCTKCFDGYKINKFNQCDKIKEN